ncbi:COP9 signalosome complex subunit 1-like [Gastrolobium bilobum]|uniref:COP9 signalosome complex subunit 1-like n=1 Tax=Gastrolobium bilobum TaxID=150636 RepID=UPI002AB13813|nr:COP9 signalosome complex subunit 1-like [Gastrolobium bilobum]
MILETFTMLMVNWGMLLKVIRTRDYCTTSKHIIHMCMSVILVSIEMGQFPHVTSYVGKAEQVPEALDPITVAKLRCAAGLANLEAKKYKLAARKLSFAICFLMGKAYETCVAFEVMVMIKGLINF